MIPYGRQDITQDDIDAVIEVLNSDFLTQGPKVPEFEEKVGKLVNANYAVAVNSATSALHIACLALNLGEGDWLWTSPITFVASANCGLYCGAKVDFVDIDPDTYNISVSELERKLKVAKNKNCLPKVVVAVHLCGQPCDMESIHRLSQEYGFKIIEDASHAIGGRYKSEMIGSSSYSDITVFSFHPVKIVTTAEGGVAVTNDAELAERMQLFRSHGITRDVKQMTEKTHGAWYYQQIELGFNYRMTEIQAAMGISQLDRLHDYVARRNELSDRYDELLSNLQVLTPYQHPDSYSGRHLYVIRLKLRESNGKTHSEIFNYLRDKGIGVNLHYIPVHTQPYFANLSTQYDQLSESEKYYQEAISLPLFQTMTDVQQDEVVSVLSEALNA